MKLTRTLLIALFLTFHVAQAHAATGCNYPTSLDAYTDKQTGDFLTTGDVNSRSCAIEQLETRVNQFLNGKSGGQTIKGGVTAAEGLFLQATAGVGAGSEFVKIIGGNNGATLWATFNQGKLLMGAGTPTGAGPGDMVVPNTAGYRFNNSAATSAANFGVIGNNNNEIQFDVPATGNTFVYRWNGTTNFQILLSGSGAAQHFIGKASDPAAPGAGNAYQYHRDNGSGKGQIVARFPSGAIQVIATEP